MDANTAHPFALCPAQGDSGSREVRIMSMDAYEFIVGTRVRSSDGEDIGQVKEILGRYFKIDAPMAPDYWLPRSVVRSADQSELVLDITREELGGYEVDPDLVESERDAERGEVDEDQMAVEAAAIVWGPDEWAVVRSRILEYEPDYSEEELDRMREEDPRGLRERFAHLIEDADRSAERLARTVEENI
jgi:hypothetical protein